MTSEKCRPEAATPADTSTHDDMHGRRAFLGKAAVGIGATGAAWVTPAIFSSKAYAAGSGLSCTASPVAALNPGYVALGNGQPPQPAWGGTSFTFCVPDGVTSVQLVASNNNPGGLTGLEFDESATFTVTPPVGATVTRSYTSWEDCTNDGVVDTNVPVGSASFDVSELFQDALGNFVCGVHSVTITHCNNFGRAAVRSFDIVAN